MKTPEVLFQDEELLVLNKPAGWIVDRSGSTGGRKTIQDWLEEGVLAATWRSGSWANEREKAFFDRAGIVHRLDKETSGLLLVAKKKEAFLELQRQFKDREVGKTYLALVHGQPEPPEGVIKAAIARNPQNREKFGVFLGGRSATTRYRVLATSGEGEKRLSLMALWPKTGRTHQIRVHLKHLGFPVVGDDKYAGRKTARADRLWCPHHFLHAASIEFSHPRTKKKLSFKAPLPDELQEALALHFDPSVLNLFYS